MTMMSLNYIVDMNWLSRIWSYYVLTGRIAGLFLRVNDDWKLVLLHEINWYCKLLLVTCYEYKVTILPPGFLTLNFFLSAMSY